MEKDTAKPKAPAARKTAAAKKTSSGKAATKPAAVMPPAPAPELRKPARKTAKSAPPVSAADPAPLLPGLGLPEAPAVRKTARSASAASPRVSIPAEAVKAEPVKAEPVKAAPVSRPEPPAAADEIPDRPVKRKSAARKTSQEAPAAETVSAPAPTPAPAPPAPAPVSPPPAPVTVEPPAPAASEASPRRKGRRPAAQTEAPAAEPAAPPAPEPDKNPAPVAEAAPPASPAPAPSREPSQESKPAGGQNGNANQPPNLTPNPNNRDQGQKHHGKHPQQRVGRPLPPELATVQLWNGQPLPPNMTIGPDGQLRKLSKWERWKLRKEKFKQQKMQRFADKQQGRSPEDGGQQPPQQQGPRPQQPRPQQQQQQQERAPRPPAEPRPDIPQGPPEPCAGLFELQPGKGFGYLRPRARGFMPSPTDPFVSPEMVRQLGLRDGIWVDAIMRRGSRGPIVIEIKSVNGREPDAYRTLPFFEELTAINPNKRYILETVSGRHTTRLIDFIAPVGRGQRGLIVAAPRAGKTTILQHVAEAVQENYPEVKLMVVLVDERPEEVTEISRVLPGAEILSSNNDRDPRDHVRTAILAIERARRLVEAGEHVFMLLDSITRLARAFNNALRGGGGGKGGGGSLSGGVDARALEGARRLFAAARNTREAGSLTIVATALVETNSRADDLIFQEFKGTGNMELVLDRKIAQQYVYPAIDIFRSGTRREELLLPPHQMEKVHVIRRGLAGHKPVEAVERLLHFMQRFPNNAQMLVEIKARE